MVPGEATLVAPCQIPLWSLQSSSRSVNWRGGASCPIPKTLPLLWPFRLRYWRFWPCVWSHGYGRQWAKFSFPLDTYCKTLNVSVPFILRISRAKQNRKIKGREYQLQAKIRRNYYSISNCMVLIRQNKGAKIILHAKSPTFWADKLKGFTVLDRVGDVSVRWRRIIMIMMSYW